jgi:hypothetical protein
MPPQQMWMDHPVLLKLWEATNRGSDGKMNMQNAEYRVYSTGWTHLHSVPIDP